MKPLLLVLTMTLAGAAFAQEAGDEVEFSAGAVTGLSCAQEAIKTGKLDLLTSCPLAEARKGIVVVDVSELEIYRLNAKKVPQYMLEKAFAGGTIDLTGTVTRPDKDGVPLVEVSEYSITPKPKPGSFKGCL